MGFDYIKRVALTIYLIGIVFSCGKQQSTIPNVLVDITVNINNPGYINLTVVGGNMYFSGGSRGIIAFRNSTDEFKAYDRHCPYQPENSCAILSIENNNVTMKCSCCSSTFSMFDGSLQSGPAIQPVKRYNTTFDGTNLRIYN